MQRGILIAGGGFIFLIVIAFALKNGYLHTNISHAPLPQVNVALLISLRSALGEEATKSEQMASDSQRLDDQLNQLGSVVAGATNELVPVVVDGLKIQNGLTRSLILLNTASYLQLELIADGIVAQSGYTGIDGRLLEIETSFAARDNVCNEMLKQEKLVSQLMEAVQSKSESNSEREIASLLRAAVIDSNITTDQAIAAYRDKIKPGTEALRGIVDKIAKSAAGTR